MRYVQHISQLVGGTPLVELGRIAGHVGPKVLAKVEYLNPGGSVKDRIALKMIDAAEASGELRPGGTIIEPTSGNTGVGLALIAQQRGYRTVFVCPDKVSQDKRDVLTAYGAEVVVCPTAVAPEHPESYYSVSDRLAREIEGGWKPNQYYNLDGPASHYETTGPEIWADTDGQVTHFLAGVGTGGTITGTGQYLKDVSADRASGQVQVVGVDPAGSVFSGGDGRPYLVEGVGEDFWPGAYDPAVPAEIMAVTDADSFEMTRRLAREEGLLVGGSCGMAVVAAVRLAERLDAEDPEAAKDAVIVVLLPDGGRGYLSKIFSDPWMASHGFMGEELRGDAEGPFVADIPLAAPADLPHVRREHTLREAVEWLREHGADVLPLVTGPPPVRAGEVVGAVRTTELLALLASGAAGPEDLVGDHAGPTLPTVGAAQPLTVAQEALTTHEAALVLDDGWPQGLLTRQGLLTHLTSNPVV